MLGGSGNDFVHGDNGSDRAVVGGEGKDFVDGGRGADRMVGGDGVDLLIEGPFNEGSEDIVSGGDGDDVLLVEHVPAAKDIVSCGSGFDRALVDRKDVVAPDCERVRVVRGSLEEVIAQEGAFFESLPPVVIRFFFTTLFEEQRTPDPTAGG